MKKEIRYIGPISKVTDQKIKEFVERIEKSVFDTADDEISKCIKEIPDLCKEEVRALEEILLDNCVMGASSELAIEKWHKWLEKRKQNPEKRK